MSLGPDRGRGAFTMQFSKGKEEASPRSQGPRIRFTREDVESTMAMIFS